MINEKIKNYWNERAEHFANATAATTNDIHLRELEIMTTIQTLREILPQENSASVLDVGCGDGYSTLRIAEKLENWKFSGVDYSEKMIETAGRRLGEQAELKDRVNFSIGDATKLDEVFEDNFFDLALTFRCLINLENLERQTQAISQIAKYLKPNGYYIAIENFIEGNNNLNQARQNLGLPEIPVRWHNLYFTEQDFVECTEPFFEIVQIKDFSSSYYFATRIVYSAMCKMQNKEPDYNHEIHQLAIHLPWTGQFSPIRMVKLRKK